MKKPLNELVPRLARGARPSAAVASGLLAPLALGAPGDLDPGFADVGRLAQIIDFEGPIWSVEALDDGRILVAGGEVDVTCRSWYCWYDFDLEATNFVSQLTEEGSVDPAFNAARPADIELRDAARQSDGKVIGVGRRLIDEPVMDIRLVVYRLEPGGSLDTTFGVQGIFELSDATHGNLSTADAVILDPDGDIVVAGSRGDELIVLRLLAGGTLDDSFGEGGVFVGPAYDHGAYLVRTAAGGYRVTTSTQTSESACRVIGLTADGAIDTSFGVSGISAVETPLGNAIACYSMESLADDRLLLTGITSGSAFATRLLATGAPDPTFAADAVAGSMTEASAIAVADDGKILIAGSNETDRLIMRLSADGALDPSFGNAGSSLIDLPSEHGSRPLVHVLNVRPDGSVVAAGVDELSESPFVIRLLGDGGGDGPGVLSVVEAGVDATEGDQVVLNVRRTGGKTGNVSVAFETAPGDWATATAGQDYDSVSGVLTWADGDTSTREIVVPVHADSGAAEEYEQFEIAMSDAQGGAGIGTRNATINIQADGAPAGQFALYDSDQVVGENGLVQIWVFRNFFYEGPVSVTVTPVAGTATAGSDFVADPVTVSWADQDFEGKLVEIGIVNDTVQEGSESFTVELSDPTGGAIIGPHSDDTITIAANDAPAPPPPPNRGGGGGGSTGFLSLLLLGLAELIRSLRRSARMRA
jgi:uncharacterized delta-60 repeat protein